VTTYLEAADQIGSEIAASAIWKDDRCNWVGAMPEEGLGGQMKMTYRALGPDLYGGTAGIGLFLAEMTRVTGHERYRRTATGALRHAISRIDDLPAESSAGLYAGRVGVVLALVLASRALDDPELGRVGAAKAADITEPMPEAELDLIAGWAGSVVGLLALARLLDDEALVAAAVHYGEALLEAGEATGDAMCWRARHMLGSPALTGLSHGAAGIAVALLELAAVTGADRYRQAAAAGFAYERALFDSAAGNWPDLRRFGTAVGSASGERVFSVFWCHGAPGGALARLRALELGATHMLQAEASAGLATTEAWVRSALASGAVNYSLCHGLAGNAEILLEGATASGTALAREVAAAGITVYLERGLPWPSGANGGATPCLFLGLAGIGRFYLRLAVPELPSLLLIRPEASADWYAGGEPAAVGDERRR
jgi:lantibiotic biosynthesis protein